MPSIKDIDFRPVERPRGAAGKFYDRISPVYDWLAGPSEDRFIQEGLEVLEAEPGQHVLELGFGTGRALNRLAEQVGERGLVCGLDLSPAMARRAQARVETCGTAERTLIVVGDAARPPLAAESFDQVFTSFTLELFSEDDIYRVLETCSTALKPGGTLVVVSLTKKRRPGFPVRVYEWLHHRFPRVLDCRPIPVRPVLEAAGYRVERSCVKAMWGLPVEIASARRAGTSPGPGRGETQQGDEGGTTGSSQKGANFIPYNARRLR